MPPIWTMPLWHPDDPNALANFLRAEKKRLKKARIQGEFAKIARVARNRHVAEKIKQTRKRFRSSSAPPLTKDVIIFKQRASPILDLLHPARQARWKAVANRPKTKIAPVITLRTFSFLDDPAATLAAMKSVAVAECDLRSARIDFLDDDCLDISPYMVLAEMWEDMAPIFSGGKMPPRVQKVIEAVRLVKSLKMRLSYPNDHNVWAFPLRQRRATGSSTDKGRHLKPQSREEAVDSFCDALDLWLGHPEIGMALTKDGKAQFGRIMGEILDNAERHSDPANKDGTWSLAAFMKRRVEHGRSTFTCHIGIVSIGASIAESLRTATTEVRADIAKYVYSNRHCRRSAETLETLYALQDGVTRDPDASRAERGGVGFQDVLEWTGLIGGKLGHTLQTRMTVVSGKSCLRLRDPYIMGTRSSTGDPRVLWCNVENSPQQPPDDAFVFDLPEHFPGTVVALAFNLDPEYLRSAIGHGPRRDQSR